MRVLLVFSSRVQRRARSGLSTVYISSSRNTDPDNLIRSGAHGPTHTHAGRAADLPYYKYFQTHAKTWLAP